VNNYRDSQDKDERDKFLEIHKPPKPSQEKIENLNRSIASKVIELAIKLPMKKSLQPKWLHWSILSNTARRINTNA